MSVTNNGEHCALEILQIFVIRLSAFRSEPRHFQHDLRARLATAQKDHETRLVDDYDACNVSHRGDQWSCRDDESAIIYDC